MIEMLTATSTHITAFQPPCIPTGKQANQLINDGSESLYTAFLTGDDLLDLGALNTGVDGFPQSEVSSRLAMRSFLHQWERSGILQGKVQFEECRVATYLTLTKMVVEIATYYQKELAVVRTQGGRIPHFLVLAWTGNYGTQSENQQTKIPGVNSPESPFCGL